MGQREDLAEARSFAAPRNRHLDPGVLERARWAMEIRGRELRKKKVTGARGEYQVDVTGEEKLTRNFSS